MAGRMEHDWVLGWAEVDDHVPLEVFVPQSDASTLLDLLWADRKHFLEAFMMTYPLGLSGVMFLLWRYWHLERFGAGEVYIDHNQVPKTLSQSPLYEVLWRCCLVAPTDQQDTLFYINKVIGTANLWRTEPVDLEDCRTVFRAYNERIAPINLSLYAPLCPSFGARYLQFVVSFVRPGVEDLLPSIFGLTLSYILDRSIRIDHTQEHENDFDGIAMIFFQLS